jgi:hypothetical protein
MIGTLLFVPGRGASGMIGTLLFVPGRGASGIIGTLLAYEIATFAPATSTNVTKIERNRFTVFDIEKSPALI